MDKVAVFTHYDANNTIKDYVVYYLKELSKIAQKIIFVSDCSLSPKELQKLDGIVCHIIAHKHGEYDFGSYKRGYLYAKQNNLLDNCEELIFANDSCYGPLYSLHDIWAQCDSDCDFWGINSNSRHVAYHIQSFFLVFKHKVFNSNIFNNFIYNIKKEKSKEDIIHKYEIGLSQLLIKNGFIPCSLFDETIVMDNITDKFILSKYINPFIKKSIFRNHTMLFIKLILKFLFHKFKITYPEKFILSRQNKKFYLQKLQNDIKALRRCIIKLHLKDKELYLFGKMIIGKSNRKKEEKFDGIIPLNL